MQPETLELPAVRVAPSAELAGAARRCEVLTSARRLAEWTGSRRITKAGHLLLVDARKAVQALGLPDDQGPDRAPARSAKQFPALHQLWEVAVETRLLDAAGGRVGPGPNLAALARDGDDDVLAVWAELLSGSLEEFLQWPELGSRLIAVKAQLYVETEPVPIGDLLLGMLLGPNAPDLAEQAVDPALREVAQLIAAPVSAFVGRLVDIDAATFADEQVAVTALGRYGLGRWFADWGISAPMVSDLGEASAAELLDLGLGVDGRDKWLGLVKEWVSARGPETAAAELVEYAGGDAASYRVTAFNLLGELGPPAEAAVRSVLTVRELAPHAKAWLATSGLEEIAPTLADLQWLFVEMIAVALDDDSELELTIVGLGADQDPYQVELIAELWRSEHPDATAVLVALAEFHPDPAATKAARKALMKATSGPRARGGKPKPSTYQLKITLLDTEPPVWRRVQVPGSVKLPSLHGVVQTAMGWTDSHLHEFEIDGVRYGETDPDDVAPVAPVVAEDKVGLGEVATEGSLLEYTYDFGDGWRHEILVEAVIPVEKGAAKPKISCLDGERACPPENIGGPWGYELALEAYRDPQHEEHEDFSERLGEGFDSEAFDADEVTRDLRMLRLR